MNRFMVFWGLVFLCSTSSHAAVTIDVVETGGDVVATASGTLNIDDLSPPSGVSYSGGFVVGTGFAASWTGGICN